MSPNHESFLSRALELARKAWGDTHPNPMVGCVLVENDEIVAEGFHVRAGEPHAEVRCLRDLGRQPREGATLYVTLEPCSTLGRTPPCVEAILGAGLRRVVVGTRDPNPTHAGGGIELLRDSGVEVIEQEGELAAECVDLNLIYNHHILRGEPFLALKLAVSADGKLAEKPGLASEVTGSAARADVMRWRRLFPAIAVGAGTVIVDDPRLTARLPDGEWCPRRIILDGKLSSVPETEPLPKVYSDEFRENTYVVTAFGSCPRRRAILADAGVPFRELRADAKGGFYLSDWKALCASEGLSGVFCEGGAIVAGRLLEEQLLDYLFWYQSPKRFEHSEGPAAPDFDAFALNQPRKTELGKDRLIRGHLA